MKLTLAKRLAVGLFIADTLTCLVKKSTSVTDNNNSVSASHSWHWPSNWHHGNGNGLQYRDPKT